MTGSAPFQSIVAGRTRGMGAEIPFARVHVAARPQMGIGR